MSLQTKERIRHEMAAYFNPFGISHEMAAYFNPFGIRHAMAAYFNPMATPWAKNHQPKNIRPERAAYQMK